MRKMFSLLSYYKLELMGISIICVMIFHSANPAIHPLGLEIKPLKRADIGVDFFLILSAIGCYFSLSNNSDILRFYKKRIIRIIPTFVVCAFLYSLVLYYTKDRPLSSFFEYITMYALLKGDIAFWYIGNILVCYLAMPFLFKLSNMKTTYLAFAAVFTAFMFFLVYNKIGNPVSLCRFPIFVISVLIGKLIYENQMESDYVITKRTAVILTIVAFLCYIFTTIVFRGFMGKYLSYVIFSIPMLLWLACMLTITPLSICKGLSFIGKISLEVYLLHSLIIAPVLHLFIQNIPLHFMCTVIITLTFAYFMHVIMNRVTNVLTQL